MTSIYLREGAIGWRGPLDDLDLPTRGGYRLKEALNDLDLPTRVGYRL